MNKNDSCHVPWRMSVYVREGRGERVCTLSCTVNAHIQLYMHLHTGCLCAFFLGGGHSLMLYHVRVGGECYCPMYEGIMSHTWMSHRDVLVHKGPAIIPPEQKYGVTDNNNKKKGLWACVWMNRRVFGPMHQGTTMIPHKTKWCHQSWLPIKKRKMHMGTYEHVSVCELPDWCIKEPQFSHQNKMLLLCGNASFGTSMQA